MADSAPLDWKFCQVFGEPNKRPIDEITEVDIVSEVAFDKKGDFLAAGDRGGRIVIFERVESSDSPCEYRFYAEFQSHEPEFDYLKSLEIEEKINKIKFCRTPLSNNSLLMLTTNDKTIKLWKVYDKMVAIYKTPAEAMTANGTLCLPRKSQKEVQKCAVGRGVFSNAHSYHINSLSLNSDGETFISSDDLRINLWNLELCDRNFNIVDIKPANMEELSEVITAAEFHPLNCHQFMYSSSKGAIRFGDLRASALCDRHSKLFETVEDPASKSFFSDLIASISDITFSSDGRYIFARDYMTVKVWDVNMERAPVATVRVHDYLQPKLCDLYESDSIFDKYELSCNRAGNKFVTATYHNYFLVYDLQHHIDARQSTLVGSVRMKLGGNKSKLENEMAPESIDYTKKPLHVAWHPNDDVIAIGASNNLYLYAADRKR